MEPIKILVCCPGNSVTGGPELLHQFVDKLRSIGCDAFVSYYPFDLEYSCPIEYRCYDAPSTKFVDARGTFFVVPETETWILRKIQFSAAAIWWLSVDNYYQPYRENLFKHFKWLLMSYLRKSRTALVDMERYYHFSQSAYALDYLTRNHFKEVVMLTDYLNSKHMTVANKSDRENIIVYNPKKGLRVNHLLVMKNPDIKFIPIEKMSATQVRDLLARAKLYIDFGSHPGKDRLPREAAMAGCCVVTGKRGAANFYEDIPIDPKYKIDDKSKNFASEFRTLVFSIFDEYNDHFNSFENYRQRIRGEEALFVKQVSEIATIINRRFKL